MKHLLWRGLGILAGLWILLTAALYAVMRQTRDRFGRVMMHVPGPLMMVLRFESLWTHARNGRIDVGSPAPDFTLPMLDRASQVRLSSFRGSQPVVLVFGSYT
jgi:hypothetical protein